MKINIKHALWAVYGIVGLLLLSAVGLYLCRNQILHYIADKKIQKLETEYNLKIHYDKLQFNGFREIELDRFSIVPVQRDTLMSLGAMNVRLNVLPLLMGNVELNDMSLDRLSVTFVKRDSISNYDFLFKKKNNNNETKKRGYNERVNSLMDMLYNYLPENGTISNVFISKYKDGHFIACSTPLFKVKDNHFDNVIDIREDKMMPQRWHAVGELNHSDKALEMLFASTTPHTRIWLPYVDRRFHAHVAFSSALFRMTKTSHFGSLSLSGRMMIDGLEIFQKKLSPEVIHLNRGRMDYLINVGSNYVELDKSSVAQFNEIQFNPYLRAEKNGQKWHVTISTDKSWFPAEQLFASLPQGLFGNLRGLNVSGELAYHFLLDVDFAHLYNLKFESSLNQRNFRIVSYGGTNLSKMNSEFMYTAYDNGRPVRTFPIGPSWNHYTPLDSIPKILQWAVLESEDGSFFRHQGFRMDMLRRALVYDLQTKRFARGGSTITMQIIKNVFLNRNKNIARKLEEALIVWLIENKHITSKSRLLEVYLNIAEWAPMIYGIQEAADFYFDKRPSQLSLEECIFLASIIPKPKHYASSFALDKETGTVCLKPSLRGYYRLIARMMAIRGLIPREEADSIRTSIRLTGRARDAFIIHPDTTSVFPDANDIIQDEEINPENMPVEKKEEPEKKVDE
jgi:hypothetical protein